jgi:hypothetical protein
MPMAPFYTQFRDLAFNEMRSITLLEDQDGLPAGTYGFLESYCDEPGCDCRTVFINVVTPDMKPEADFLATINYGWEDLAYYTKWLHGDKQSAREMKGPALSSAMVRQSKHAPVLLDLFKEVLRDEAYVERLKRHYRMFREAIDKGPTSGSRPAAASPREPSRNAPCPCGSGRKYKGCCGKNSGILKSETPKTDPAFEARLRERLKDIHLPQHEDQPPVEFLKALVREFPDPGAALARLAAHDGDERIRQDAEALLFVAVRDTSAPEMLKDRIARSAIPILRAALKDPGVSDERKLHIGAHLSACGCELPHEEYKSCFRDFKATAQRYRVDAMKEMSPSAASVEDALGRMGLLQHDEPPDPSIQDFQEAFGFGLELAEHNPEAGGIFLAVAAAIAAEHGKVPLDAQSALLRASQTATPAAAWCLSELSTWPGLGVVGEKAGELAAEMRGIGIAPEIHSHREFSHGTVSGLDGLGSRSLMLLFRTPEGRMDALGFLLNDEVGMKDVWCAFDRGAQLEEKTRAVPKITLSPIAIPLARELIGDALALHQEREKPPPGRLLLYRPYLGGDPLRIQRRRPNLGAYALEVIIRSPDLAAGSERLCEGDAWEELWCASDEAYAFVRKHFQALRHGRALEVLPDLVERFIKEVAIRERDRLLSRMAANLEVEAWAGRAGDPLNRVAARTWIVISEELQPFHEISFVRSLASRSLEIIYDNVGMGFRTQREANEASTP